MFLQKHFWNPYCYSVSCDKIENRRPLSPLRCGFFKESNFEKRVTLGIIGVFSPKHPDYEKTWKIYWPLPVGHTHTTFRDGSPQKAAQENTHTQTSSQDMKWRSSIRTEQSRERKSQDDDEHWKETNQNPTQKYQTNRRNTKKGNTPRKKTTNPNNASTRDKLDRKQVVFQTPKRKTTRNKKQQRIRHSIKT